GHGCSGSPTTALRIEIPEGVTAVAPQAKSGWRAKVEYVRATPPQKGKRPSEVVWKGAPLAPDKPSEFRVKMNLPPSAAFAFPTTQTCAAGSETWSEMAGDAAGASHHPAPMLYVGTVQTPAAVSVTDAWIRWVPAGNPAGGYFTLHNTGDKPITL